MDCHRRGLLQVFTGIEQGQGGKVLFFGLLAALIQGGLAVGITAADSLFLSAVGAKGLPFIYLAVPVLMTIYLPLYAWANRRMTAVALLRNAMLLNALGALLIFLLYTLSQLHLFPPASRVLAYSSKLYATFWFIAGYTIAWNFIDRYFDISEAKRLYPLFNAAMAFGTMTAGGLVTLAAGFMPVRALFLIWALGSVASLHFIRRIEGRWTMLEEEETVVQIGVRKLSNLARQVLGIMKSSGFTKFLIALFFVAAMATSLNEYLYMEIIQQGRSTQQLASVFGRLYFYVNLFNLCVNLLLFYWLARRVGVANLAMVQPIAFLFSFSLIFFHYGMAAGITAFFVNQGLLVSIDYNNQNLLFNALPREIKAEARAVIEGFCEPGATALAGLGLIVFGRWTGSEGLALAGLGLGLGCLAMAYGVRSYYGEAMARNLREAWTDPDQNQKSLLSRIAHSKANELEKQAQMGGTAKRIKAMEIMAIKDVRSCVVPLLSLIQQKRGEEQAKAGPLLHQLLNFSGPGPIAPLVSLWLESAPVLCQEICEVLASHGLLLPYLIEAMSHSAQERYRPALALSRLRSGTMKTSEFAKEMKSLLEQRETRSGALRVIGLSRQAELVPSIQWFQALDDETRIVYLDMLLEMAPLNINFDVSRLAKRLPTAPYKEARAILQVMCRYPGTQWLETVIDMAPELPEIKRNLVTHAITSKGIIVSPFLIALITRHQGPKRNFAISCLGKVAPIQLEALASQIVEEEARLAEEMAATAVPAISLSDRSLGKILTRWAWEATAAHLSTLFLTLGECGRLPEPDLVEEKLAFPLRKERANALEAIEEACGSKLFSRIYPLIHQTMINRSPWMGKQTPKEEAIKAHVIEAPRLAEAASRWLLSGGPGTLLTVELISSRPELTEDKMVRESLETILFRRGEPLWIKKAVLRLLRQRLQGKMRYTPVSGMARRLIELSSSDAWIDVPLASLMAVVTQKRDEAWQQDLSSATRGAASQDFPLLKAVLLKAGTSQVPVMDTGI